jgi:hypothetical protein
MRLSTSASRLVFCQHPVQLAALSPTVFLYARNNSEFFLGQGLAATTKYTIPIQKNLRSG